jgi:hypothetical protein
VDSSGALIEIIAETFKSFRIEGCWSGRRTMTASSGRPTSRLDRTSRTALARVALASKLLAVFVLDTNETELTIPFGN